MNTDELEKYEGLIDAEGLIDYDGLNYLLTEVKRLQAYKEFADGIHEWSHGAIFIHFLAEQVYHIRDTGELDEDAMNHGCQQYYNGPNSSSQASMEEYKELRAEVKKLQAWKLWVCALVQQHDGPHLREMLKELIE
jgi:hypothetical protein